MTCRGYQGPTVTLTRRLLLVLRLGCICAAFGGLHDGDDAVGQMLGDVLRGLEEQGKFPSVTGGHPHSHMRPHSHMHQRHPHHPAHPSPSYRRLGPEASV